MPEISRSFHYWQPASTCRLRPLPWLANPSKPAMSPQALEERTGTHHTDKKERGGREGKKQKLPGAKYQHANAWLCLCNENDVCSVSTWNCGTCAYRDTAGHRATLVFFVVNSVKLHLTTN